MRLGQPGDQACRVGGHAFPLVGDNRRAGCHHRESGLAVESLYGQALMLGHHPIRPADAALLNTSFLGLLNRAMPGGEEPR